VDEKVSFEIAQQQIYAVRVSATTEFPGNDDLKVFEASTVRIYSFSKRLHLIVHSNDTSDLGQPTTQPCNSNRTLICSIKLIRAIIP
jgi:hypothetical protein